MHIYGTQTHCVAAFIENTLMEIILYCVTIKEDCYQLPEISFSVEIQFSANVYFIDLKLKHHLTLC